MLQTTASRAARLRRDQATGEFDRQGYLILPGLLDPDLLASARAESVAICRGDRGDIDGVVHAAELDDDETVLRRYLCIHFPHKVSTLARDLARLPAAVQALNAVIGPNVKMMQSMLFIKSEGKPGQAWHQDETHIPTRDRSLAAVWIALDDATVENGCLWVIPGSHRAGVLYPDREQDDPRFDCTREAYGFRYREEDAVPVELKAGSASRASLMTRAPRVGGRRPTTSTSWGSGPARTSRETRTKSGSGTHSQRWTPTARGPTSTSCPTKGK